MQRRYLLDEELPRQEMRREFGILSVKRIGARTSLIVDPPNGRIPPPTPVAEKPPSVNFVSPRPLAGADISLSIARTSPAEGLSRRGRPGGIRGACSRYAAREVLAVLGRFG